MIYLQNIGICHLKYSISLGWESSKGTRIIHRYGAPFRRSALKSMPCSPRYNPETAKISYKPLQIIPVVLICRVRNMGYSSTGGSRASTGVKVGDGRLC